MAALLLKAGCLAARSISLQACLTSAYIGADRMTSCSAMLL